MEMFAADFHREGGVTGSGTPGGPRPMHKAGTGAGDAEARAPAADLNSDNMGDCHHGEVLVQVGANKQEAGTSTC